MTQYDVISIGRCCLDHILAAVVRERAGADVPIIYDCERRRSGLEAMMRIADYFIPTFAYLEIDAPAAKGGDLTAALEGLRRRIAGRLIVTHGENGCYAKIDHRWCQVLPPAVQVRDTTGAGDNFHNLRD